MRFALRKLTLPGAMALLLTGCQQPPAPVPVAPAPPPPPMPTVHRQPVAASWTFRTGSDCDATASSSAFDLDVTATSSALRLVAQLSRNTAMPRTRLVSIGFTGTSGTWAVTGRRTTMRRVIASQPMTEKQAGQILVLLEGGTVRVGTPGDGLPPLQVPNGGAPGRDWFECVRRQLFP